MNKIFDKEKGESRKEHKECPWEAQSYIFKLCFLFAKQIDNLSTNSWTILILGEESRKDHFLLRLSLEFQWKERSLLGK